MGSALGHSSEPDRNPQRGVPPAAVEIDHAARVVAAYDTALAEGVGAVTLDGKMIDLSVERARLLLARETAIAGREAKKRAAGAPPA
jgi:citrate lyase beta subunit